MSSHPAAPSAPITLSIPKELRYPTPVYTDLSPAPTPRRSLPVRLLPLVGIVGGYTSALAWIAHRAAAASALLLAFAALVGPGWGVVGYPVASVRHHRPVTDR